MTPIVVDAAMRRKFHGVRNEVPVLDESGNLLGYFAPAHGHALNRLKPEDRCPYSEADLQRFEQETGGVTLAEFWAQMGRTC